MAASASPQSQGFPEKFWDFSLKTYPCEGVAPTCLGLQARHGIDVNLLLYCCWFAASGRGTLDESELKRLLEATRRWQDEVAGGLRAVKHRMKKWGDDTGGNGISADERQAFRKRVAALEVDAEMLEQEYLERALDRASERSPSTEDRARDAATNLARLLPLLGLTPGEAECAAAAALIAATFPALDGAAVEALSRLKPPSPA
ncbi:MAG: TIGR02444 family protein [Alphaproteobacteria bacterium]